jgi:hypothetical protein
LKQGEIEGPATPDKRNPNIDPNIASLCLHVGVFLGLVPVVIVIGKVMFMIVTAGTWMMMAGSICMIVWFVLWMIVSAVI